MGLIVQSYPSENLMNNISRLIGRALLVPISWIPASRLYGRIMRMRRPRFLSRLMIRNFQKHYRISMDEFQGKPEDYGSLSDFFLRPLDPARRPLPVDGQSLLCSGRRPPERTGARRARTGPRRSRAGRIRSA